MIFDFRLMVLCKRNVFSSKNIGLVLFIYKIYAKGGGGMSDRKLIAIGAKCELARRFFFDYCCLKSPDFYKPNRTFLKRLCDTLQNFPDSKKKVLLVDLPPRLSSRQIKNASVVC